MIRIHRDIEDASHIVVQLIHGGCKSYVYSRKFDTLGALHVAVHAAALGMGADQAETERILKTALKSCETLTRELEKRLRLKQLNDVIDKWDMAFSGRTFPNREVQIKIKKKPSHMNSLGK